MCKLFTVWFPKELMNVQAFSEFARIAPNFRILFENREFVNLFWWFFFAKLFKIQSWLNNVATAMVLNKEKHKISNF